MATKTKRAKITPDKYALAKKLLSEDFKQKDVQTLLNASKATMYRITHSDSYESYLEACRGAQKKKPELKTVNELLGDAMKVQTIEGVITDTQGEIIIEVLNKILDKVSIIADKNSRKFWG